MVVVVRERMVFKLIGFLLVFEAAEEKKRGVDCVLRMFVYGTVEFPKVWLTPSSCSLSLSLSLSR